MIELKDLSYVRLGASNLEDAESFATKMPRAAGWRADRLKRFICDRTIGPIHSAISKVIPPIRP